MLWQNLQRRKELYQSCHIDAVLQRPGHNLADHFIQHVPLDDGKTRWNAFASWQVDYSPPRRAFSLPLAIPYHLLTPNHGRPRRAFRGPVSPLVTSP